MKESQVPQAWKSLMSSPFKQEASKDENTLELEVRGEKRWANS